MIIKLHTLICQKSDNQNVNENEIHIWNEICYLHSPFHSHFVRYTYNPDLPFWRILQNIENNKKKIIKKKNVKKRRPLLFPFDILLIPIPFTNTTPKIKTIQQIKKKQQCTLQSHRPSRSEFLILYFFFYYYFFLLFVTNYTV